MTPWELHKRRWKDCRRCSLHEKRQHVVLLRGKIPADVLFVGEAPGPSEDVRGIPFDGPAGQELDGVIAGALQDRTIELDGKLTTVAIRYALTNVIACIPLDEQNHKVEAPPDFAVDACTPRLADIIKVVQPRLIVMLGDVAEEHVPATLDAMELAVRPKVIKTRHPAYVIRLPLEQKGLELKRMRVAIRDAVDGLFAAARR